MTSTRCARTSRPARGHPATAAEELGGEPDDDRADNRPVTDGGAIDLLLKTFDAVATENNTTIGIISNGPREDSLRRQIRALDSTDRMSFLDHYDGALCHIHTAVVFASPSAREGFGITYAEAMAAGCTVIGADHPDSAADEVVGDAGYLPEPTVDGLAAVLDAALSGDAPPGAPEERVQRFDWNEVATQAERVYRQALRDP